MSPKAYLRKKIYRKSKLRWKSHVLHLNSLSGSRSKMSQKILPKKNGCLSVELKSFFFKTGYDWKKHKHINIFEKFLINLSNFESRTSLSSYFQCIDDLFKLVSKFINPCEGLPNILLISSIHLFTYSLKLIRFSLLMCYLIVYLFIYLFFHLFYSFISVLWLDRKNRSTNTV